MRLLDSLLEAGAPPEMAARFCRVFLGIDEENPEFPIGELISEERRLRLIAEFREAEGKL